MINTYLNLNPYKIPGRWYRFVIESTGSSISLSDGDIEAAVVNGDLELPEGFKPIDMKMNINYVADNTSSPYQNPHYKASTDKYTYVLPSASKFDLMTMYIFGYEV